MTLRSAATEFIAASVSYHPFPGPAPAKSFRQLLLDVDAVEIPEQCQVAQRRTQPAQANQKLLLWFASCI
jgi:hypothetical protein